MKLFVLLLALTACSGCGLWDAIVEINGEIGYSEEEFAKTRRRAEASKAKASKAEGKQVAATPTKSDLQQRTEAWWKNATTLGPAKKTGKNAMIRCRIRGAERFTRPRDCAAAGGTVIR